MNDIPVIDVQELTKAFSGKVVVNRLSLQVRQGEIFGFLGPNGSGKTTFIRMLCGLLRPDGGGGRCLGFDLLREGRRIRPHIGYMAQRFSLYEDLSVRENLDFMASLYRVPERRQAVAEMLQRMALTEYSGQLAGTLSGGWKQRLALAACLLHRPQLLLLDEPTAGVDPKARRDFWDDIYRMTGQGMSVLISTHYMDEAERCHRLAYLSYGDLLTSGSAEEIVARSGLHSWTVTGPGLPELTRRIETLAGVEQVLPLGNTLRVSGHRADLLEKNLAPLMAAPYLWTRTEPSLEEVFIHLTGGDHERTG